VDAFLASPDPQEGKAATEAVLARFFTGRIHHHVTTAHEPRAWPEATHGRGWIFAGGGALAP
jgi:hypothetical protein